MPGEINKRVSGRRPLPAPAQRAIEGIAAETRVGQAVTHAKTSVAEHAVGEVSYLHAIAQQHKQSNPDAAAAIDLIVGTTVHGIARSLSIFNAELD